MSLFTRAARLIAIPVCSGAAVLGSTANGAASPSDTLMGMLPQGFSSANCQEAPKKTALAKVTCDQNSDPAGPAAAVFALYGNLDELAAQFQDTADRGAVATSCPGGQASPGTWSDSSSGQTGGQAECATMSMGGDSKPAVIWTDNGKMMAAAIIGSDMTSLYQWWIKKSG
jgi:hypothetical protein